MLSASPPGSSVPAFARRLAGRIADHPELIWLGAIVVAGAAARFLTLGLQSFDSGETVTAARILHPSYTATLNAVATTERSGPLYYSLAWAWANLFGTGEVALRTLSAGFGSATIVVAFLAARELFSSRAALIAAALVASSPDLFWYSQEARSYPLFILLSAGALYFFARSLRRPGAGSLAGWAVASALALSTHYFAIFAIAPEAAWLIVAGRRRLRGPLLAVGAVAAAGLMLLPLAIHQEGSGRANGFTSIPVVERAASGLVKFAVGEGSWTSGKWAAIPPVSRTAGLIALAAFALAITVLFARGRADERRAGVAIVAVASTSLALPVALALGGLDYVEPRNLLGSLVPLIVVVAAGVDVSMRGLARSSLAGRVVPALAVAAPFAALILLTETTPALQRDNWRALSDAVADSGRVGVVITDPPAAAKPLDYYLHRALPRLGPAKFPCGVWARKIVIISRGRPESTRGPFRLVEERQLPQHWRFAAYVAARPRPIDGRVIKTLDLLKGSLAEARVDAAHAISAPAGRRFALRARGRRRPRTLRGPRRSSARLLPDRCAPTRSRARAQVA
jgi:mannosyltransferase